MKREKNGSRQQQFGKMAGSALIRTFSFQINISAKMKVSASKSATSPSCKTMWQNPLRSFRHIGSADYIRRCCSSLRELRTSVNLLNPKNGSKLPSRDFANPPNRYMLCLDKNTAEKQTQKFILFLPNLFLPTLISTFAKSQRNSQRLFCKRADFFHRF